MDASKSGTPLWCTGGGGDVGYDGGGGGFGVLLGGGGGFGALLGGGGGGGVHVAAAFTEVLHIFRRYSPSCGILRDIPSWRRYHVGYIVT